MGNAFENVTCNVCLCGLGARTSLVRPATVNKRPTTVKRDLCGPGARASLVLRRLSLPARGGRRGGGGFICMEWCGGAVGGGGFLCMNYLYGLFGWIIRME